MATSGAYRPRLQAYDTLYGTGIKRQFCERSTRRTVVVEMMPEIGSRVIGGEWALEPAADAAEVFHWRSSLGVTASWWAGVAVRHELPQERGYIAGGFIAQPSNSLGNIGFG